jgi:hypothetical protein
MPLCHEPQFTFTGNLASDINELRSFSPSSTSELFISQSQREIYESLRMYPFDTKSTYDSYQNTMAAFSCIVLFINASIYFYRRSRWLNAKIPLWLGSMWKPFAYMLWLLLLIINIVEIILITAITKETGKTLFSYQNIALISDLTQTMFEFSITFLVFCGIIVRFNHVKNSKFDTDVHFFLSTLEKTSAWVYMTILAIRIGSFFRDPEYGDSGTYVASVQLYLNWISSLWILFNVGQPPNGFVVEFIIWIMRIFTPFMSFFYGVTTNFVLYVQVSDDSNPTRVLSWLFLCTSMIISAIAIVLSIMLISSYKWTFNTFIAFYGKEIKDNDLSREKESYLVVKPLLEKTSDDDSGILNSNVQHRQVVVSSSVIEGKRVEKRAMSASEVKRRQAAMNDESLFSDD